MIWGQTLGPQRQRQTDANCGHHQAAALGLEQLSLSTSRLVDVEEEVLLEPKACYMYYVCIRRLTRDVQEEVD